MPGAYTNHNRNNGISMVKRSLNNKGFAHHFLLMLVVVLVGIIGIYTLMRSLAESQNQKIQITSYNTESSNSPANTQKDIKDLESLSDIIGLQEMNTPLRTKPIAINLTNDPTGHDGLYCNSNSNWCGYFPFGTHDALELPIMWQHGKFDFKDAGSIQAYPSKAYSGDRDYSKVVNRALNVNWARLKSNATNRTILVLNVHAPAHLESGGKPVGSTSSRPKGYNPTRYDAYKANMDTLVTKIKAIQQNSPNAAIFITGDFNVDWRKDHTVGFPIFPHAKLGNIGYFPFYSDTKPPVMNTEGNRLIDYVFLNQSKTIQAVDNKIIPNTGHGGTLHSDHNAIRLTVTVGAAN
jgi:hypothetical protein